MPNVPDTPKKAKRLILHAGLPKTATTSIQNAIFRCREILFAETGIYYPGTAPNHTNDLCTAFLDDPRSHISNKMAGLTDLDQLKSIAANIRSSFEAEIAKSAPETILFSAEGFSNLSHSELGKFRDWALNLADEISVIYIVRNPLRYVTSVVQQHLKGGEVLEDMYQNPPMPNCKGRINNAIAAFGREAVSVHTFEDMVKCPDGVTGFFLDKIGAPKSKANEAILKAQTFENESLSHEAALILSSLNRQRPAFVNGQRGERRTLSELGLIQNIKGRKFYLPDDVRKNVVDLSMADIAWLEENFGIDQYRREIEDSASEPAPTLSPETIDSMALILSDMINERHINFLTRRARQQLNAGDEDNLPQIVRDIKRIAPLRPLPPFLISFDDSGEI